MCTSRVAFCSAGVHPSAPRRLHATCSARTPPQRGNALRVLGALALSLTLNFMPHQPAAASEHAHDGPDHEELAKYPALEIGHEILVPKWVPPPEPATLFPNETEHHEGSRMQQRREVRWEKDAEEHYSWNNFWKVGNGLSMAEEMQILFARLGVVTSVALFTYYGAAMSDRLSGRVQLPQKYDPKQVALYFRIRPDRIVARFLQLSFEMLRFGLLRARYAIDEAVSGARLTERQRYELNASRRSDSADMLCDSVSRLGPAFIKLAQAASMRPDVVGSELARKLSRLQDSVTTPFATHDALALIREQLGARPSAIFDSFDKKAVAGASLGMVWRATLDGRKVAVKVQRPGVAESIALDFFIVRSLVGVAQRVFGYRSDVVRAVDEYASRMFEELDYCVEAENTAKFKKMYDGTTNVVVPAPVEKYTARKVLITDFVEGNKIIDENYEVKVSELPVVEAGIRFALTQLLDKGFLHADMHNGNMLTNGKGELVLIDFGIVVEIPEKVREAMVLALFYLMHGEYRLLAETCVDLALLPPHTLEAELPQFSAALAKSFGSMSMPLHMAMTCDVASPVVCRFSLIGVAEILLQLGGQFPFVFNSYFVNSLRCVGMLEGLAMKADPYFSVLDILYPFIMSRMLSARAGSAYRVALERVLRAPRGAYRWDKLDGMLREVQRAESGGVGRRAELPPAAEDGSALDDLMLSPNGGFLRKELVREWTMNDEATSRVGRARVSQLFRRASFLGKLRLLAALLPAVAFRTVVLFFAAIWNAIRLRRNEQSSAPSSGTA